MLMSKLLGERFKEKPSEATSTSHVFLLRGGYVRQVTNGIYTLLPPAKRIAAKIENIIREEMDAIDAAVKRRKHDLGSGVINPETFAKNLSKTVSNSINTSIAGLQESLKDFAWDLVQKENPNLSEDELNYIVDSMIPDILATKKRLSGVFHINKFFCNFFCAFNAVYCRRHNSSCIACTLSYRIKTI